MSKRLLPSRLTSRLPRPRPQTRFYADVRPTPGPSPQPDDSSWDPRPPWVYRMARLLHLTVIPSVAFYCVFFADFGDRGEHVFMPARRWAATQKAAFFTLSPAEETMLRDEEARKERAAVTLENHSKSKPCRENCAGFGTMQTASAPYYPHQSHPSDYDPHLHGLKRHYLNLLPPPQVIEICLAFEPHAPVHIKSSIWPLDLNGAITALQAHTRPPPASATNAPFKSPLTDETSLVDTSPRASRPTPAPTPTAPAPQSSNSTPQPPGRDSDASTQATTSTYQPPQLSYPHQAYGYAHPQAAYPHAPYYPQAAPGSSHPSYPPYPPTNYPHTNALFTNPPDPPQASTEDLPSYEEMIVEALLDSGDPEGCAPKDLFSTMAARYPLQTNFRPSASQALQKAFKRGRLEKSSGGKYRINAAWEGGNTSRRTTRRPQTHLQTTTVMQHAQTHSPFTHAPLIRQPTNSPHHPAQPHGYPPLPAANPSTTTATEADIGEGSDAWGAAQNILKAINFGRLLQLPDEDEKTMTKGDTAATTTVDGTLAPVSQESIAPGPTVIERAELQALLALLAAQLGDIAQAGDGIGGEAE